MFVIYINNILWENISQIFEVNNLEVKLKLNDISTASFEVSNLYVENNYVNFKEFNEVTIYKIENNLEKLMFSWIIRSVEADLFKTKVILNDKIFLLKNKLLYSDKTYENISINSILTEILNEINSRYDSWIILETNATELVTKSYRKWQTYFDVLKDLALNWYEFEVKDNKLYFKESIWIDRISWAEFVEFSYDIKFPWSRTIDTAKMEYDSDNIASVILQKDTWESVNTESTLEFWRNEKYFTSWDKDILLEERKWSVKEYEITPIAHDFFVANLWDTVKVFIDAGNDIIYFNGWLKVIEKNYKSWELDKVSIRLSTWSVKTLNLIETIQDLRNRTRNLEI